jgi:hypothetical protein
VVLVVDPVNKYGVFGIIQRIINEKSSVEGAVPEEKNSFGNHKSHSKSRIIMKK